MVTAARKGPAVNRKLNPAEGPVLERLAAALGPGGVVPVEPRYLEEPRGRLRGRAAAVLRPRTVDEVAAAVRALRRGAGRDRALFRRDRPGRRADLRRRARCRSSSRSSG